MNDSASEGFGDSLNSRLSVQAVARSSEMHADRMYRKIEPFCDVGILEAIQVELEASPLLAA